MTLSTFRSVAPLLLPFLPLALLTACAKNAPPPEPTAVAAWAEVNLSLIPHQPTSPEWEALLDTARIPADFEYSKSRLDFNGGKNPVFNIDDRNFEMIKDIGITSSVADFCKLDFEALNFFPMMQWQRSGLPEVSRDGYEIYVLGVAHGYAMGKTDQWLKTNPVDCEKFERALDGKFFSQVFGAEF